MIIMALNCGSSSVKYQLFNWDTKSIVAKGMVERVIIGDSFIMHEVPGRETTSRIAPTIRQLSTC